MNLLRSENRSGRGQALIEFALVLPLLFLLILNVVNFGGMLYAWITVANAARAGAQYLMMGVAYVNRTGKPDFSTVISRVTEELAPLPNSGSSTLTNIKVCMNNNNVITCTGSGGSSPPNDQENSGAVGTYIVGTVDVTYTYTPYINAWSFPSLKIYLTTPPTAIHRQAVMRMAGD